MFTGFNGLGTEKLKSRLFIRYCDVALEKNKTVNKLITILLRND